MHEVLRDPGVMSAIIRRRVLRAMVPAVRMLDRVARGVSSFASDQERMACVALARLAPVAMAQAVVGDALAEDDAEWAEQWMTPEKLALLEQLSRPTTREEIAESWARSFLEGTGMPSGVDTLEKAREYGRERWDHVQAGEPFRQRIIERVKRESRRKARGR